MKDLVLFVGRKEEVPSSAEVSITFVDKEEIQQLNLTYRAIDEPTDVISFEMQAFNPGEIIVPPSDHPLVLGDIIVCVEVAKDQALTYNHSFKRELGFLIVHGILHLLGYDHATTEEEKEMFSKQTHLLREFGLER